MVALLCAAICVVTLLTVGRTAAAEELLLSRLDTAGSRLLTVTDDQDAGLVTPAVIGVIAGLDTTERVLGIDAPVDVTNAVIGDGGIRVPAWTVTGSLDQAVTLTAGRWPGPGEAVVSAAGQRALGLAHPAGAVVDSGGREYAVVGSFTARAPFGQFGAGVVVAGDNVTATRSVQVVVTSVEAARVSEALTVAILAPPDLGSVTVQSPTALADLQRALGGDFGDFGRGMLALSLGGGAFLIAVIVLADVLLRRRDLGRRRALGAPRWGLVALVVTRTVTAAVPGAIAGTLAGAAAALAWAEPAPADFTAATALLTVLVAALAAVAPALLAATRDPVGVLRTP
jgi:putative ABC transport system permease protein